MILVVLNFAFIVVNIMNVSEINPYIRLAMRSVLTYPFIIKRRIIFDYELIYIDSGEFTLEYAGRDFLCRSGDVIFLRPGISHEFRCTDSDLSQPHIHFDLAQDGINETVPVCFDDIDELPENSLGMIRHDAFSAYPSQPILKLSDMKTFLEQFYFIVDNFREHRGSFPLKIAMMELIGQISYDNFPDAFTAESHKTNICDGIKAYLDSNICSTLSLDSISRQFNYSKYYLDKKFKEHYGCSIIRYHQRLRMEYARKLLETTPVSQVCEQLGFGSVSVFSRAFSAFWGFPPSDIRRKSS